MWWDEGMTGPRRDLQRARRERRRASHSMEAVLTEAVALLDEAGEPALTSGPSPRGSAAASPASTGTSPARTSCSTARTDHVLGRACWPTSRAQPGPRRPDRRPAHDGGDAVRRDRRPAVAGRLLHAQHRLQPNSLRLYERLGRAGPAAGPHSRASGSTRCPRSSASSSASPPTWARSRPQEVLDGTTTREDFLGRYADSLARAGRARSSRSSTRSSTSSPGTTTTSSSSAPWN